jgi:hydrogenase-4 transcriptional activator
VVVLEGDIDPAMAEPHVRALVPVLQVALANDRRVHELERLREAVEADNRALLTRLQRQDISESIVGAQTGLREVMERVQQVAPTDAPVLILGETGSGKEVVARSIHTRSTRHDGPFLRVNCGAIPPELVDSELFGHERGSFTGAVATRRGWFERADGGTLFLDEVGELPAAAQVRLLRVLQDGAFERVGGSTVLTADVRIVAATHRDMHEMLAGGLFREDLWYRISVFPIALPPLRNRLQDIPALAAHFASSAGLRLHGVPLHPTDDDLAQLSGYDWPGNVRELAAVIERAAILGGGTHLDVARSLGDRPPVARRPAPVPTPVAGSLEAVNREAIHEALSRCRGRIEGNEGAAAMLGIHPATLRSRMRKLGIEWQRWRDG